MVFTGYTGTNSVGGMLIPSGFFFEEGRVGGIPPNSLVHEMALRKRVDVEVTAVRPVCSRASLLPSPPAGTIVIDRRVRQDAQASQLPSYRNPTAGQWLTLGEAEKVVEARRNAERRRFSARKIGDRRRHRRRTFDEEGKEAAGEGADRHTRGRTCSPGTAHIGLGASVFSGVGEEDDFAAGAGLEDLLVGARGLGQGQFAGDDGFQDAVFQGRPPRRRGWRVSLFRERRTATCRGFRRRASWFHGDQFLFCRGCR